MKQLYSNILGEGAPLLILHGFLGMSDNWKTLGSRYADAGFEVHLIDQRNHGRSFHDPVFHYKAMTEDLMEYTTHHKLSSFDLIGHSMGGKTAMFFACAQPSSVNHLIVADIAPKYYPPHHQEILSALQQVNLDEISDRTEAELQLSRGLKNKAVRQFLLKNLYRDKDHKFAFRFNLQVLAQAQESVGEQLKEEDRFNGATLFVKGSQSNYITESDEALIHRHFPQALIREINPAGHWLHAEQPEQFFETTLSFLKS